MEHEVSQQKYAAFNWKKTKDSRFYDDVSEYGVEIQTDTVIKQTVKGTATSYRTFYKDGNTTILPVDSTGKVVQKAEPIYTNGVWDQSKITELSNVNNKIVGVEKQM